MVSANANTYVMVVEAVKPPPAGNGVDLMKNSGWIGLSFLGVIMLAYGRSG